MATSIPVDSETTHPTITVMAKVVIHVEGGLVQAVYSTEELDIHVYDLDVSSYANKREIEEAKAIAAQLDEAIRDLQQIY